MRFYEEYRCGCTSKMSSKKNLQGYCETHGADRVHVYRQDGLPADAATLARALEVHKHLQERVSRKDKVGVFVSEKEAK